MDPSVFLQELQASMDTHEATCEHCHTFARQVVDDDFGPPFAAARPCPGCTRGQGLAVQDGPTKRCAACGFPLLPGHRLEILWSEVPGWGIHQGWGGSDVWICACGWNEGEEEPEALDHARETRATIAVVPDLVDWVRGHKGFTGPLQVLPARQFRTFDHEDS